MRQNDERIAQRIEEVLRSNNIADFSIVCDDGSVIVNLDNRNMDEARDIAERLLGRFAGRRVSDGCQEGEVVFMNDRKFIS